MKFESTNIGIIIFSSHENGLINFVQILSSITDNITIFTSSSYKQKVVEDIDRNTIKWVEQPVEESRREFLNNSVTQICKQSVDILLSFPFYGIKSVLSRVRFRPRCTHIQLVYNTNLWMMNSLRWQRKIYRYLDPALRQLLLRRFDGIIVEFSPIKRYLSDRIDQDVYSFTPLLYVNKLSLDKQNNESQLVIIIPGNVTSTRRDYETIFSTIRNHLQSYKSKLTIELLGDSRDETGEAILRQCATLSQNGWNIITYEGWVPTERFNKRIQTADAILAPMRRTKDVSCVTERYGISKGSGCFIDAVMYGKPLILPAHYQVPSKFDPMVSQYGSESGLARVIKQMIGSSQKQEVAQKHAADTFNITNQRDRLREILFEIVE